MKHCIIMTAYKDAALINAFVESIPDDWGVYIHLDKKSSIQPTDISDKARVFSWKKVYWGAWEHLYVMLRLMQEAMNDGTDYDYYHTLTGQDFFATAPADFDKVIEEGKNYLEYNPLLIPGWWFDGGYRIYQFRTVSSFYDVRYGRGAKINYYIDHYIYDTLKRHNRLRPLPKFPLYGGSLYCTLHKDFVAYCLTDRFPRKFLRSLKHTLCGEELYFQTVIMNSPFRDTAVNDQLRHIVWVEGTPKLLTPDDGKPPASSSFARSI